MQFSSEKAAAFTFLLLLLSSSLFADFSLKTLSVFINMMNR